MSEFFLIDCLHQYIRIQRDDVVLPSADDCAVVQPPVGMQLAISTDTLIADRHFPRDTSAHAIGYKALAVNLSDLAAMGGKPAWVSLALSLPDYDEAWVKDFARGFSELAAHYQVQLIGGDTTAGDLSITVNIIGFLPEGQRLLRSGAGVGDDIYISGHLGAAGYELAQQPKGRRPNLDYPRPRVELGEALLKLASSTIDVSDGLLADLGHILMSSQKGADINLSALPIADVLSILPYADRLQLALSAGDEYELCFTVCPDRRKEVEDLAERLALPLSRIGTITADQGLNLYTEQGERYDPSQLHSTGFNHFGS